VLLNGAYGPTLDRNLDTTFLPQSDPILDGRYQAWRKELEAALRE